ncbi:uncharacterized protein BDW47DRAFT_111156 [Aspergillus candidus]|uniref:Uncharacterized protein n=1 Tax=Aspergillus candidus TaxID=41067 RepID=A0A2I2F363_ASPCN|nr:hypothetical protein BDW47DRAFT_111156 [Aspergillus candidus]PLB35075.1 hypothetical protein BDW47DRAFT_111156 [Aspergillus candidus]
MLNTFILTLLRSLLNTFILILLRSMSNNLRLLLITQQLDSNVLPEHPLREADALSLMGMRVKEGDGLSRPETLFVGEDANAVAVGLGDQLGVYGVGRDADFVLDLDPLARVFGRGVLAARVLCGLVVRVVARAASVVRCHADLRDAVGVGVDAGRHGQDGGCAQSSITHCVGGR